MFASLYGTVELLEPEDRARIRGFIINKFRGDATLFADGVGILKQQSKLPVLGVVPYALYHGLPEEDAVSVSPSQTTMAGTLVEIVVARFPHLANFDDFDPLQREPGVRIRYVDSPEHIGDPAPEVTHHIGENERRKSRLDHHSSGLCCGATSWYAVMTALR